MSLRGKAAAKQRRKKQPGKKRQNSAGNWTEHKKIEAATTYLVLGKWTLTAAATKVPLDTLKFWGRQEWWKTLCQEIKNEDKQELSGKLKQIVDKTLTAVLDRVEYGDHILDSKSGEVIRVPMKGRDLANISKIYIDKREEIEEKPERDRTELAQADRLLKLAEQFVQIAKNSKRPQVETIDAKIIEEKPVNALLEKREERLQDGIQEIPLSTGTNQEPIYAEPSKS